MNLERKAVILVHGLAAKPPADLWMELSKTCLIENIGIDDPELASGLTASPNLFGSGYWADAVPHHVADDEDYCGKLKERVNEVIEERKSVKDRFHVGQGRSFGAFFKDKGLDVANVFMNALTIKDNVMQAVLLETKYYAEQQYIADKMRGPLENTLKNAWDAGKDVALLTHSMGTFIAYDVLWRFSHCHAPEYRKYQDRKVSLFVTMGSPLCDSAVRNLLFAYHYESHGIRAYLKNVLAWHNYRCLGDVVCHGADFEIKYFKPFRKNQLVPKDPDHLMIDYENLYNPFRNVEHDGNKGKEKRNPHKEYGYYVQPRLGTWLRDFLKGQIKYA